MVLLTTLVNNFWVIDKNNFFYQDDIGHLNTVKQLNFSYFTDIKKLILPQRYYNDRPFGILLIKILSSTFQFNYQYYHLVFLIIHLVNTFLVYLLVKKILATDRNNEIVAAVTGLIFGSWFRANFAVQWIAAVFDILGLLFGLIYLILSLNKKQNIFTKTLALIFLIASLRTKEAFIFLPLIPFAWQLIFRKKINKFILFDLLIFLVYFLIYLQLKSGIRLPTNDPYYTSLSPLNVFKKIVLYTNYYFSVFQSSSDVSKRTLIFLLPFSLSLFLMMKKNLRLVAFFIFSYTVSFMTIAPLVNKLDQLYLFTPSIFLSFYLAYTASILIKKKSLIIFLALIFIISLNQLNKARLSEIKWWLKYGKMNRLTFNKLNDLPNNKKFFLYNLDPVEKTVSILSYQNGLVFNLINKKGQIAFMDKSSHDLLKINEVNFCLVNFNHGDLKIDYCR